MLGKKKEQGPEDLAVSNSTQLIVALLSVYVKEWHESRAENPVTCTKKRRTRARGATCNSEGMVLLQNGKSLKLKFGKRVRDYYHRFDDLSIYTSMELPEIE